MGISRARYFFWLAALACGPLPAVADDLEEVIVTASLRQNTQAELAASVTVLDSATLRSAGQQHLQDILGLVPDLNWASGTSRPRYFQLRGVGELDQYQGAPNPSVGFLIDDIDFSGVGMPATSIDLGQVEVLRGPQGTSYGANALAGLISVRTQAPRPESELRTEASLGNFATWSLGAIAGGALPGALDGAFRLVAQQFRSDGFRRNEFLGRDSTNGYDERTLRARTVVRANGALTFDVSALAVRLDNGYDAFALDNSRVTHSDKPGRDAQDSHGLAVRAVYQPDAAWQLRSVTTVADSKINYSFDGDWGSDPNNDFTESFKRQRRSYAQDVRIESRDLADAKGPYLGWLLGAYALRLEETNQQRDIFNSEILRALESRFRATSAALYGQLDWHFAPAWRASAGARVERRNADYRDNESTPLSPSETMWGGNLSIQYDLATGWQAYGSLSRGFKAGGFNIGVLVPDNRRQFSAELLTSAELGLKWRSVTRHVSGALAAFAMRRGNEQVSTSYQVIPGDPLSFIFITDNAARGRNSGIEAEGSWQATAHWEFGGALTLLRTEYLGYAVGERNLNGRAQAHAPAWQYALHSVYTTGPWFARIDLQGTASFYYDTSHDERSAPFHLVNARVGYDSGKWAGSVYARNLFDQHYAMRGFFFGNRPPDFAAERFVQSGDPRQIGVNLSYSFH